MTSYYKNLPDVTLKPHLVTNHCFVTPMFFNLNDITIRIEPLKEWHDVINLCMLLFINKFPINFYLSSFYVFFNHFGLYPFHCMWLGCISSFIEDSSHGFLASRWLVHNRFVGIGNLLEFVVHYLLIRGMVGLRHWDGFPMVSILVCMVNIGHDLQWVLT